MSYTLLPNSGQSLGETRGPIRTNFQLLQQDLDKNHVSINDADRGKHKYVELKNQATIPAGLTAGEYTLYAKSDSVGPAVQLFGSRSNSGVEVQFTQDLSNTIPKNSLSNGGTFLPGEGAVGKGALLMRWGQVQAGAGFNDGDTGSISFSPAFPTTCLIVYMTMAFTGNDPNGNGTASYDYATLTASGFDWVVNTSASGSNKFRAFNWLAIGY